MSLNRRQEEFVTEYLNCWNASEAARRAGYSPKTAYSHGQRLLKDVEVASEIESRIAERQIKPAEVLERLGEQARSDIGEFFMAVERWTRTPLPSDNIIDEREVADAKGNPVREYLAQRVVLDLSKLKDPRFSRLVKKFSDTRNGINVELYDAQRAQELLGKALGVLRDNVTVNQEGSLEIVTRVVRQRDDVTG